KKREPKGENIRWDCGELLVGGLYKGIGNFIDLICKMAKEGTEWVTRTGEFKIKGMPDKAKGVYGFTVKMGLGGVPTVEQFGNIRETAKGPVVEEVREPIVDVFDEEDKVLVIAELPGVGEDNIHLEAKGDILTISAEDKDRKYSKEVLLPSAVDASTMKTSYKNGILEIVFPKAK
ncbi:HSP20 family protein, partial [Candidatus Hakubella thermalkaliphila]